MIFPRVILTQIFNVCGRLGDRVAIKSGLVDEYHLSVAPLVVGGGKQSLPNDVRLELELLDELLDERRFGNGVVHFHYLTRT
jgi:dihydrofolate reductase